MKTKAIVVIAFVALFVTACGGNPVHQDAVAATSEPAAAPEKPTPEPPTKKSCVASCTDDYPTCVAHGDGSAEENADCEAEFRACASAC
ncbi:MAG: hypothetical protein FD165_1703 [Gammaproteobacteria bacterium]|nr:MAG: hypothetical protein FD165_1703 [Gammaproteobacteria bacterium]TND04275.1 MAG: hypothetical protein FD120_1389 [Gammaproteobacteria bacterium]